ncbi:MAG: hypothetical protein ABI289_01230 [Candidatus Dormibacter sp.]
MIELPLTVPVPVAVGLLVVVDEPPVVLLCVEEFDSDVALPLPPVPDVDDVVAAPPEVVPVVVVEAAVPLPPPANAGEATRVRTSAVENTAVIADDRYDVKRPLIEVVSPGAMPSLLIGGLNKKKPAGALVRSD